MSSNAPRIVIIEDDRTIGLTVQAYLQSEGYAVEWYQDGAAGIQAVYASPPNIILLDLLMPVLDGFGAIEILSELGLAGRTIVVTALTHEEARGKIAGHGAAGYITKPLKFQVLAERIKAVLAAQQDVGSG